MTDAKKISQDSIIYNYTLAKKTTFGPLFRTFHLLLLFIFEGYEVIQYKGLAGLFIVLGIIMVFFLHRLINTLLFTQAGIASAGRWKMNVSYPLIALLPTGYVAFGTWKRLFTHTLIGGLCVIAFSYVWCPLGFVLQMLFLHLWVLFPLLWVSLSFRNINKPGMIKWQQADCSYYYS